MNWQTFPYLIPYLLSLLISATVGLVVFHRRNVSGAREFSIVAFSQALWTLGYVFELASPTLEGKIFWDDFQWLGGIGWYFGFIYFAIRFTEVQIKRPKLVWTLIGSLPTVFILLLATNQFTGLTRGDDAHLVPGSPFDLLEYELTPVVITFAFLNYLIFFAGLFFLLRNFPQSRFMRRRQLGIILIGTIIPLFGTFLALAGVELSRHRDTTPLTFAISNIIVLYGLTRFRLFNLRPVASEIVIENMVDAVIILDVENRFVDQNPAGRKLTGAAIDRLTGRHVSEVFSAWPELTENLEAVPQYQGELVVDLIEEDTKKQYKLYVSPLRSQSGFRIGHVILGRNITDLEIVEDALRDREEKYRQLVENTSDWVWTVDLEGNHTYSNPAVEDLLGYSVDEIMGRPAFALMHPDDQDEILGMVRTASETGTGWQDIPIRWQHKNGSYHVFESSGQPLRNPLGELIGFSGIDRDITTRVEMEEALRQSKRDLEAVVEERTQELRQSEEKYRSVIETANEGIFVLKGDNLAFVNPKTSEISGYSQEELLSIPWVDLIHPIDKEEVTYQIGDYLSGKTVPEEVERFRMVDKQGNVRWIESNLEFISWEGENAIMAIVSDVTEKVHAESELRDFTEQLDILHQIDQAILAAQSVEEIAHTALDHMKNVIPFTAGSIILFDLETNKVHRLGKVVPDGYELDPEAPLGNGEEDLALLRMLERGETFYLAKASGSEQWPEIEKRVVVGLTMETILGVPIILEGDLIGIVMVAAPEAEAFRSNHIDLAHQVGAVLAVALRQARLFEAEQKARQTAETMQSANLALTKSLALDEVLDTFLEVISEVIPYHSANVMLYEDERFLVVRASRGYDHFMGGNPNDFPGYSVERIPIFAEMKSSHQSLLVSNTAEYLEWVQMEEGKHINSWIGVPLISGGAFIGLLALDHTEPDYYTGEHLKVAELMALQATIAIQNANLFEQTTRRARELEEITLISSALRQAKRSEEMFSVLLDEVASFFESDAGVVFLTDQPGFSVSSFRGREDLPESVMQHEETMELVWEVAQSGVPLYVSEQPIDSRYREDINSIAAHPLSTSEGIIGVVLLAWADQRSFSPADRRLLKAFADITGNALDRARILETLEQQVSNRTRDLSVLYQVTSVASAHSDLKTITDKSLERILEAVGGTIGTIHVKDPDDQHFQMVSQQGIPDEILDELDQLPMDDQFFGAIAQYNEPLVIMDFTEDSRVPKVLLPLDCEVFIGTPIKTRGELRGILGIYLESSQQYNTDNVRLLMVVVDQMGIALERALLQEQAEEAIIIEERQRLARDLHDAVSQSLYSLMLMADAARKFNDQEMWARSEHFLRLVQNTAQDVLKEMRLLVFELRPTALENEGFVNALRQRLDTVESRAGVETSFEIKEATAPPIDVQVALYRISQEALNNALKHAQATSVRVEYVSDGHQVKLEIIDNGLGFDQKDVNAGIGLKSMRERVEKIGGEFSVTSESGEGTSVCVKWEARK